jgi:predicted transposase/invertase (TIGR01784 family)
METDSFFYQLLKQLPETLFALLGQPLSLVADYRFDAMEIKKSYRLDGLFVPRRKNLPLYFVEVQFQRRKRFYANLFAKVFSYLEANNPDQEWMAIALFGNRVCEPKSPKTYEEFLQSKRVRRIYLDELSLSDAVPPGLTVLQLASAADSKASELVLRLLRQAQDDPDCERGNRILQLTEEILIRRYHDLDREEIRHMFKLHDIRKTKVWQEARDEGREEGRSLEKQQTVRLLQSKGHSLKEIAQLLDLPLAEVRRLAKA